MRTLRRTRRETSGWPERHSSRSKPGWEYDPALNKLVYARPPRVTVTTWRRFAWRGLPRKAASIEGTAAQVAKHLLKGEGLSQWQVGFLEAALIECACYTEVIHQRDCMNELLQMNSQHRHSLAAVARAMTGLVFECSARFNGERMFFKLFRASKVGAVSSSRFSQLATQLGWGSNAHRAALGASRPQCKRMGVLPAPAKQ